MAASGTRKAALRSANEAPPKRAMAPMGVKFGGCGTSLDTAARRTATIKKAGRGEESEGAIGRSAAILSSRHFLTFLPVRAEGCRTGKAGRTPHARIMPDLPRARSGAPLASLDGQVFWLTATIDPRAAFPRRSRRSDILPRPLADYSSGPATDSHRLPFSSTRQSGWNPSISGSISYRLDTGESNHKTCPCSQENGTAPCSARRPSISAARFS